MDSIPREYLLCCLRHSWEDNSSRSLLPQHKCPSCCLSACNQVLDLIITTDHFFSASFNSQVRIFHKLAEDQTSGWWIFFSVSQSCSFPPLLPPHSLSITHTHTHTHIPCTPLSPTLPSLIRKYHYTHMCNFSLFMVWKWPTLGVVFPVLCVTLPAGNGCTCLSVYQQ